MTQTIEFREVVPDTLSITAPTVLQHRVVPDNNFPGEWITVKRVIIPADEYDKYMRESFGI